MRLIGMLRVKNEARWIERVLRSMQACCEHVVLFDDHSEDGTPAIAAELGATVMESPFAGLDEVRDKNALLEHVHGLRPDWILHIDGDEELTAAAGGIITAAIGRAQCEAYSLQVLYLWDREDQVRTDGIYGSFWRPSLFRSARGQRFTGTGNGGNFHCGNIPMRADARQLAGAALLHYGYMDREDRLRKYGWYNSIKPVPVIEDGYRHMVIGDLFPATSRFRHAGPLQVVPL